MSASLERRFEAFFDKYKVHFVVHENFAHLEHWIFKIKAGVTHVEPKVTYVVALVNLFFGNFALPSCVDETFLVVDSFSEAFFSLFNKLGVDGLLGMDFAHLGAWNLVFAGCFLISAGLRESFPEDRLFLELFRPSR